MPTRLTSVRPPPAGGAERVSAQITPYCSPGDASCGTAIVTLAVRCPPARTSDAPGLTDVHVDRSSGVRPAAPTNEPLAIAAAAGYRLIGIVEAVVFETSIRRWTTVPGRR